MKRVPLYPLAIAAWLTLLAWSSGSSGDGRWVDAATSLAAALLVGGVGLGLGALTSGDRDRRGTIATVFVLWSALFSDFVGAVPREWRLSEGEVALLWSTLAVAAALITRRLPLRAAHTRALSIASLLLLAFQVIPIGATALRGEDRAAEALSMRRGTRHASAPDIYVIVLDKYTATRWLSARYAFDNRPFEHALRELNFFVPTDARSNYPHTGMVLATLFNGRPVHEIVDTPRAGWHVVFESLREAPLWNELKGRGYRFAFFPTTFNATSSMPAADLVLNPATGARRRTTGAFATWNLRAPLVALASLRCGLRGCRTVSTASTQRFPYPLEPASAIRWKFETLATLPDSSGPLVAFLHVLAPHEPYQFNADCSEREPWWPQSDEGISEEIAAAYIAQLQCVNAMLLTTVRELLARSTTPPIIIVQSDHGHGQITRDALRGTTLPLAELPVAVVRERLDVFAAYYAPSIADAWYETISPANVLPIVMNGTFGTQWPRTPDRWWWIDDFNMPLSVIELGPTDLTLSTDAPPSP